MLLTEDLYFFKLLPFESARLRLSSVTMWEILICCDLSRWMSSDASDDGSKVQDGF